MKKWMSFLFCLMLLAAPAQAEEAAEPALSLTPSGEVTGDFDVPAPENPEARYTDYFVESTDGSENAIFMLLDFMNDEAEDMKDGGALFITENILLSNDVTSQVFITLQQSPYGPMLVGTVDAEGIKLTSYNCGNITFGERSSAEQTDSLERMDGLYSAEDIEFFTTSYHFPYGRLECLQGVRQDENGYTYYFIKSDETISFEFVTGEGMRILQLRMYARDDDGVLRLASFTDYETGPAPEIPQEVLDAFGEVMDPVPAEALESETDENGDNPAE